MRLLVCGDREWTNEALMKSVLLELKPTIVIEGEARGADRMARNLCYYNSGDGYRYKVERYPAQWSEHGRAAGYIRNQQMIDEGKPDLIVAFHNYIEQSVGTADMLMRAEHQRIHYALVTEE